MNLETLLSELSTLYGEISLAGEQFAQAHEKFLQAEHAAKLCAARLHIKIRSLHADAARKLTEVACASMVEVEPEMVRTEVARIEAEANRERLKCALAALHVKRDALQSIGAILRQEMQSLTNGNRYNVHSNNSNQ